MQVLTSKTPQELVSWFMKTQSISDTQAQEINTLCAYELQRRGYVATREINTVGTIVVVGWFKLTEDS